MNILNIAESGMCIGCGTCDFVCPHRAIKMSYKPDGSLFAEIDETKCTACGLCEKICPSSPDRKLGISEDEIFYKNLGKKAYIAYATDEKIRQSGQSGGVLTAILKYLLDREIIHGVALCKYDFAKGAFKSHIAKSTEDVLNCTGSNYIQIPHCKAILENADVADAAVLLGCQAEALDNYEKYCKDLNMSYRFGLICAGSYKKSLLNEFSKDFGNGNIDFFRFRDKRVNGVPGDTVLHNANGETITFEKSKRVQAFKLYKCMRCMACNLKLNNSSDLLFGDPWGISLDNPDDGYTVVISQSEKGDKLLEEIKNANGYLHLEQIPVEAVVNGQFMKQYKAQFYNVYRYLKQNGRLTPYSFNNDKLPFSAKEDVSFAKSMDYFHEMYSCKTSDEAEKILLKYKKNLMFKNKIISLKQKLKRPVRKIIKAVIK